MFKNIEDLNKMIQEKGILIQDLAFKIEALEKIND